MTAIMVSAIIFWLITLLWMFWSGEDTNSKIANIIAITSNVIISIARLVLDVLNGENWKTPMIVTCVLVVVLAKQAINEVLFLDEILEEAEENE